MFRDAFTLLAEVIETDAKSVRPFLGDTDPSVAKIYLVPNNSETTRLLLSNGHQDAGATGLKMPPGNTLIGATSNHLVIGTKDPTLCVGSGIRFQMIYGTLMRARAAPDTQTNLRNDRPGPNAHDAYGQTNTWHWFERPCSDTPW
ncbi:hypothetical protein [uncultured Tateyamaria sp.]|uniref:hypothetical protein n=1 Tax=uncultured Tateyamaria sp. TaxID=455651 RepID=UPI00261CB2B6|nr:hypothetical protein [uncultured Tateyamaria sp.]